jgi:phenylalanine-4-hydroxylase
MWNNTNAIVRSYGCRFGFYTVMIAMLWYSSHLQIQSQLWIFTGTNEVTQALRYSAIMIMEQNEYQATQSEEQRMEELTTRYHHAAHYYHERAKEKEKAVVRSRTRSEYFDYLTKIDAEYENVTYHMMLFDDHLRLELLQNISQEEDKINASYQEQMMMESSPCYSWVVFENVCTILRIVPDRPLVVSQQANEVRTLIEERAKLNEVEQEEYICGIVTAILQGYVTIYNHTARELLQQSIIWDQQMRHDLQMAQEERTIAHEYDIAVQDLQTHIQQELIWLESNKLKSNTLLHNATYHIQLGRSYMQYSTVIGFIVLIYFVTVWFERVLWIASNVMVTPHHVDWSNNSDGIYTILWRVSYMIQHVLIFFVTCGLTLDDVVLDGDGSHMLRTVSFFAFLAALLQTTLLHTLPHIVYDIVVPAQQQHADPRHRSSTLRRIGMQYLVRMVLNTISFGLELSVVWLVARNILFTKENLALCHNGAFVFLFFVAVAIHTIVLEQRRWNNYAIVRLDEEATVLLNSDDDGTNAGSSNNDAEDVSIATSVDTHNVSTNPTERMPFVVLRGFALTNHTNSPSISTSSSQFNNMNSPNHFNTRWEFIKLIALFDTLLVSYIFMMLHNSGSTSTMMIVFITVLSCIGGMIASYLRFMNHRQHGQTLWWSNEGSIEKGTAACSVDDETRLSFSKTFQTYNSIDV